MNDRCNLLEDILVLKVQYRNIKNTFYRKVKDLPWNNKQANLRIGLIKVIYFIYGHNSRSPAPILLKICLRSGLNISVLKIDQVQFI